MVDEKELVELLREKSTRTRRILEEERDGESEWDTDDEEEDQEGDGSDKAEGGEAGEVEILDLDLVI